MNSFTEKTWTMVIFGLAQQKLMQSYIDYSPRPLQSESYTSPMSVTRFRTIQQAKKLMQEKGVVLPELEPKK